MITLKEAQSLKVDDKIIHAFFKNEWVVKEVRLFKTNLGRVTIDLKHGEIKWKLTEKNLHLALLKKFS